MSSPTRIRTLLLAATALIASISTANALTTAQEGAASLRGSISSVDGQPLIGAAIRGVDNDASGVTDGSGRFHIGQLAPGAYLFEVSYPGFEPVTVRVTLETGQSLTLPSDLLLLERTHAEFESTERARGGVFIGRSEIDAWQPRVVTDLLRHVPGVRIQHGARGAPDRFSIPWRTVRITRTRSDCPPILYVNGAHLGVSDLVDLDGIVQPQDLEVVQVYRGIAEVPARFSRPGAQCGVLLFWTR